MQRQAVRLRGALVGAEDQGRALVVVHSNQEADGRAGLGAPRLGPERLPGDGVQLHLGPGQGHLVHGCPALAANHELPADDGALVVLSARLPRIVMPPRHARREDPPQLRAAVRAGVGGILVVGVRHGVEAIRHAVGIGLHVEVVPLDQIQ